MFNKMFFLIILITFGTDLVYPDWAIPVIIQRHYA